MYDLLTNNGMRAVGLVSTSLAYFSYGKVINVCGYSTIC